MSHRILDDIMTDDQSPKNYPQIELSIMETGIFREIGNVTNIGTWTETYRTEGITFNVGRGIMSTIDGQGSAPWKKRKRYWNNRC